MTPRLNLMTTAVSLRRILICMILLYIPLNAQERYEIKKYFNSLTSCSDTNASSEEYDCVYFKIEYPYFIDDNNGSLNEIIKIFIYQNYFDKPYNNFDIYSKEFFQEYEKSQLSYKSPDWWYTVSFDTTIIITNRIIAISFGSYKYMGGAHGAAKITTLNYEKETGRVLDLDNLFLSDYEIRLNDIMNSQLKEKSQKIYFFDNNNYSYDNINSRFLLGQKEIIFKFDWYDEAFRNGAGDELRIPYSLLKNILSPEYSYLTKQ